LQLKPKENRFWPSRAFARSLKPKAFPRAQTDKNGPEVKRGCAEGLGRGAKNPDAWINLPFSSARRKISSKKFPFGLSMSPEHPAIPGICVNRVPGLQSDCGFGHIAFTEKMVLEQTFMTPQETEREKFFLASVGAALLRCQTAEQLMV
jgi:hypothetical protein